MSRLELPASSGLFYATPLGGPALPAWASGIRGLGQEFLNFQILGFLFSLLSRSFFLVSRKKFIDLYPSTELAFSVIDFLYCFSDLDCLFFF